MKKILAVAVALGLFALAAGPALAGTDTTTFQVTANVVPSCKFTAATAMNFGSLDVPKAQAGTPIAAQNTISVLCTAGGSYSIDLNYGANPDPSNNRRMTDGASHYLGYDIFVDQAATQRWTAGAGNNQAFSGDGLVDSFTAYGQLPWNVSLLPNSPVGSYIDTVTATVNY